VVSETASAETGLAVWSPPCGGLCWTRSCPWPRKVASSHRHRTAG